MINYLASITANRLFNENDKYPMDIYIYGIELLISTVISTILILLAGLITNSLIESIIFLITFSLIRIYTGGYHCMTYLKCNLLSVLSFVLVYVATHFLGDYFSSPFIMAGGYVLTMAMAGLFAPVRHTNKEISAEEAKKYKILALLMITLCYTLCASAFYIFGVYQTLIIFPTCLTVDIAMLISIVNNYYIFRRKTK